jgi:hypothetical protein
MKIVAAPLLLCCSLSAHAAPIDATAAGRFAQLALDCVHREYPNKISHLLTSAADAKQPHELTPAFYGCYDWHSSVHGHWLLARAVRMFPQGPFAEKARAALAQSLTTENLAAEVAYLRGEGRSSFERPYGLAWLLTLASELRAWNDPQAQAWSAALAPLETEVAAHLTSWLPNLSYPIRVGEHDQTAFAFGLVWNWAQQKGDAGMIELLRDKARQFYGSDRNCSLAYEPSGQDFLSPCIAEADFVRRTLDPKAFATWLSAFLPKIPTDGSTRWLPTPVITDRSDPKLAHLDGLNLSRAWMLEGIARGLPKSDARAKTLHATAAVHRDASLGAVSSDHYVGSHWLATFAMYGTSVTTP